MCIRDRVGAVKMDANGVLQKGLLIRHLVLPKGVGDSIAVLEWIASNLPRNEVLISLMAQYTPSYHSARYPEIDRRVSTYEYNRVLQRARELGLDGYMQELSLIHILLAAHLLNVGVAVSERLDCGVLALSLIHI